MQKIDYFDNASRQVTQAKSFGLCDDNDKKPAYIDISDRSKWIASVENAQTKEIVLHPIDNCVKILRDNGKMAERCEGILCYDNRDVIIFVELKDRELKPAALWCTEAEDQIKETMFYFFRYHNSSKFSKIRCWISNRQLTNQNYWQRIKQFKRDTNYVLYIQRKLSLPI